MNYVKIGALIRNLRKEKQMTQLQLGEKLHVSDKAVSKWERGLGCPDVSLIGKLSQIFEVDLQEMLSGELSQNEALAGDMRKMKFYICPNCGNLVCSMTDVSVTCCGRKMKSTTPVKAKDKEKLFVQLIENEYFVSSDHEMTRDHYITVIAFLTTDTMLLKKQYPEWDLAVRIPRIAHGSLVWYCSRHGLFYQMI